MQSAGVWSLSRVIRSDFMRRCKQVGKLMFRRYLFVTNVGISFSLSGVGDVLQQNYEILQKEREVWDSKRTRDMSLTGVPIGVICHLWYNFLDKRLPGRTIKRVAQKVVIDQILFSPVCISIFFITLGVLEKSKVSTVKAEIIQKGWLLYAAEWMIWPPAQVINFYWLPTRYRVLYDNTISLGYDVYTSYVKHGIPLEESNDDDKESSYSLLKSKSEVLLSELAIKQ